MLAPSLQAPRCLRIGDVAYTSDVHGALRNVPGQNIYNTCRVRPSTVTGSGGTIISFDTLA